MTAMERRQSVIEASLTANTEATKAVAIATEEIKKNTADLVDIFAAARTTSTVFKRAAKFTTWLGGLSVAVTALWILIAAVKDGKPPSFSP